MFKRAGANAKTMTSKFTLPSVLGVRAFFNGACHKSRSRYSDMAEVKSPGKGHKSKILRYVVNIQGHDT